MAKENIKIVKREIAFLVSVIRYPPPLVTPLLTYIFYLPDQLSTIHEILGC